jgi:hypothetical protein
MNERLTNLVNPEPLIGSSDQSWKMSLHILNVIQLRSHGVVHIHNDDFPIRLAFVKERHDTENFDLLDLADVANLFADLAHVERVVITLCLCLGVDLGGVFPSLCAM